MRSLFAWCLAALCTGAPQAAEVAAVQLSPAETRWLQGAWPVLLHGQRAGLPLDVVVQPQPAAGLPPIAMAWVDGRCKMVFSLRDNVEAEATLRRIETGLMSATLELMAAHELGHCWRHVSGHWRRGPDGAAWPPPAIDGAAFREQQATRLEEGLADLVGLAWVRQRHAALYPRLHAWLLAERLHEHQPGSGHDTLRWVHLAAQGERLDGDSIFTPAMALWRSTLADAP